ncbi:hypothetical protein Q7P37_006412 [Cladosporium fusiforme]
MSLDDELLPSLRDGLDTTPRKGKKDAATGAYAAGMRALSARMLTFYFRAPAKAFFRTRVDYMGYVRAINPSVQAGERWSWRMTSPAMLAHAVREHGWSFIPNQVLPPLVANTMVGAVLYAGYLQTLATIHEPSSLATKRVYPPPSFGTTFSAGFIAGSIQSILAAPVDALQVRFQATELMEGKYKHMWSYAYQKTKEIGARGIFAGWSLSFLKDSIGYGFFFGIFEFVKAQSFYSFVSNYYGQYGKLSSLQQAHIDQQAGSTGNPVIRPYYMIEPTFIALAGIAASLAQQTIQHPLSRIQDIHYGRLEYIDAHEYSKPNASKQQALRLYASAYNKTWKQVQVLARREGGMRTWLYKDFFMSTLRQAPSTSIGLIVFEIARRKYSMDDDEVKIEKDGYDILLS